MDKRLFNVSMQIIAPNEETVHNWLSATPGSRHMYDVNVQDDDAPRFITRIRYDEDYDGRGEAYVFECKWTHDNEWSLDCAYYLRDDMISYEALTKIRELKRNGVEFTFA